MVIYTYRSADVRHRIEATVRLRDGGYVVGDFYAVDARVGEEGGWSLMRRRYTSLAGLLLAVERRGYFVDTASCGI